MAKLKKDLKKTKALLRDAQLLVEKNQNDGTNKVTNPRIYLSISGVYIFLVWTQLPRGGEGGKNGQKHVGEKKDWKEMKKGGKCIFFPQLVKVCIFSPQLT